ncbi:hypothetical protein FGM00_18130 [Aggregatimonas sangjinii]|uniref:Uncharacterized protein n=1 Tax=Aggregatimonas sangjinii TaxID=2583587 RepID=A0A5B7SXC9_9FLAO|nr:hypothetical protein [Aggregatimonas sangjinii]QCX01939.1 hypothetical protein FGM00_18130 [Aggregatimonas sangjinii]
MPAVVAYLLLVFLAVLSCVLFYIPRNNWFNARVAKEEGWGTFKILLIGMCTSLLCFVFSKLLFSAFCLSISSSIIEYNILMNNVYWYDSELLSPLRNIKYPISYFGMHTLSYFAGLYAVLFCLSKLNITSSYNLSHDRLKLQFMCLGLFMFFETLLYVSYPFQTFDSAWRVFHNFLAVFLARLHFTACLFIAAWLHFHHEWVKLAVKAKVLSVRFHWLSGVFESVRNTLAFFVTLGALFLLPAYIRMYSSSSFGLFVALLFNGGLLFVFWRWVSPAIYHLMRFISDFEKRKAV